MMFKVQIKSILHLVSEKQDKQTRNIENFNLFEFLKIVVEAVILVQSFAKRTR